MQSRCTAGAVDRGDGGHTPREAGQGGARDFTGKETKTRVHSRARGTQSRAHGGVAPLGSPRPLTASTRRWGCAQTAQTGPAAAAPGTHPPARPGRCPRRTGPAVWERCQCAARARTAQHNDATHVTTCCRKLHTTATATTPQARAPLARAADRHHDTAGTAGSKHCRHCRHSKGGRACTATRARRMTPAPHTLCTPHLRERVGDHGALAGGVQRRLHAARAHNI
jgi:hypothetical protein